MTLIHSTCFERSSACPTWLPHPTGNKVPGGWSISSSAVHGQRNRRPHTFEPLCEFRLRLCRAKPSWLRGRTTTSAQHENNLNDSQRRSLPTTRRIGIPPHLSIQRITLLFGKAFGALADLL